MQLNVCFTEAKVFGRLVVIFFKWKFNRSVVRKQRKSEKSRCNEEQSLEIKTWNLGTYCWKN